MIPWEPHDDETNCCKWYDSVNWELSLIFFRFLKGNLRAVCYLLWFCRKKVLNLILQSSVWGWRGRTLCNSIKVYKIANNPKENWKLIFSETCDDVTFNPFAIECFLQDLESLNCLFCDFEFPPFPDSNKHFHYLIFKWKALMRNISHNFPSFLFSIYWIILTLSSKPWKMRSRRNIATKKKIHYLFNAIQWLMKCTLQVQTGAK